MTEQEAISGLKRLFSEHELDLPCTESLEVLHTAIKALEEVQQYRSIGTVEELKQLKGNGAFTGIELAQIAAMQMTLKKYREIGTPEECQAAVEKQKAKKPKEYEDKFYGCPSCGNILLHKWEKYNTKLMNKKNGLPYCLSCGQKLDWSDEE